VKCFSAGNCFFPLSIAWQVCTKIHHKYTIQARYNRTALLIPVVGSIWLWLRRNGCEALGPTQPSVLGTWEPLQIRCPGSSKSMHRL